MPWLQFQKKHALPARFSARPANAAAPSVARAGAEHVASRQASGPRPAGLRVGVGRRPGASARADGVPGGRDQCRARRSTGRGAVRVGATAGVFGLCFCLSGTGYAVGASLPLVFVFDRSAARGRDRGGMQRGRASCGRADRAAAGADRRIWAARQPTLDGGTPYARVQRSGVACASWTLCTSGGHGDRAADAGRVGDTRTSWRRAW